jgi:hypothetical protein
LPATVHSDFISKLHQENQETNGYSPLQQVNEVTWNDNATARELKSIQEITSAKQMFSINKTNIVVNHPAIQWQGFATLE